MINTGKGTITTTPHIVIMPSLAILIVSLAFNFVGDGLRNALDPQAGAS
jgi:ABC-type dipeptide/oligopeptide/nickel transport system permease subunit